MLLNLLHTKHPSSWLLWRFQIQLSLVTTTTCLASPIPLTMGTISKPNAVWVHKVIVTPIRIITISAATNYETTISIFMILFLIMSVTSVAAWYWTINLSFVSHNNCLRYALRLQTDLQILCKSSISCQILSGGDSIDMMYQLIL